MHGAGYICLADVRRWRDGSRPDHTYLGRVVSTLTPWRIVTGAVLSQTCQTYHGRRRIIIIITIFIPGGHSFIQLTVSEGWLPATAQEREESAPLNAVSAGLNAMNNAHSVQFRSSGRIFLNLTFHH